jgi:hypothetical protein
MAMKINFNRPLGFGFKIGGDSTARACRKTSVLSRTGIAPKIFRSAGGGKKLFPADKRKWYFVISAGTDPGNYHFILNCYGISRQKKKPLATSKATPVFHRIVLCAYLSGDHRGGLGLVAFFPVDFKIRRQRKPPLFSYAVVIGRTFLTMAAGGAINRRVCRQFFRPV